MPAPPTRAAAVVGNEDVLRVEQVAHLAVLDAVDHAAAKQGSGRDTESCLCCQRPTTPASQLCLLANCACSPTVPGVGASCHPCHPTQRRLLLLLLLPLLLLLVLLRLLTLLVKH